MFFISLREDNKYENKSERKTLHLFKTFRAVGSSLANNCRYVNFRGFTVQFANSLLFTVGSKIKKKNQRENIKISHAKEKQI